MCSQISISGCIAVARGVNFYLGAACSIQPLRGRTHEIGSQPKISSHPEHPLLLLVILFVDLECLLIFLTTPVSVGFVLVEKLLFGDCGRNHYLLAMECNYVFSQYFFITSGYINDCQFILSYTSFSCRFQICALN